MNIKNFEIIEDDKIKTYKIEFDKEKIKNFKKKIKEFSVERVISINYNVTRESAENYVLLSPFIECDEFVGEVTSKNNKNKLVEEVLNDPKDIYYGAPCYRDCKVIVKNYPILYNVLFGKYKYQNDDLFKIIYLYMKNKEGLIKSKNGIEIPLEFYNNTSYDSNISNDQKRILIEQLFNAITITLEKEESLKRINKQIDVIESINIDNIKEGNKIKKDLLKVLNQRIDQAYNTTKYFDSIFSYIDKEKIKVKI